MPQPTATAVSIASAARPMRSLRALLVCCSASFRCASSQPHPFRRVVVQTPARSQRRSAALDPLGNARPVSNQSFMSYFKLIIYLFMSARQSQKVVFDQGAENGTYLAILIIHAKER